jgi:hypothetical protein
LENLKTGENAFLPDLKIFTSVVLGIFVVAFVAVDSIELFNLQFSSASSQNLVVLKLIVFRSLLFQTGLPLQKLENVLFLGDTFALVGAMEV